MRRKTLKAANRPLTYSVKEVAEILNMGLGQAYAAIHRGDLPVIWIGRKAHIPSAKFHAMFDDERAA